MNPSPQQEEPPKQTRIIGYDVARALAVFGMVIVNYKVVMGAEENGAAWLVWLAGLFTGRAAATFVILAGVGIAMLARKGVEAQDRERIHQDRRTLLKRAVFLFVVGLLYTPLWPADILHFYGIYIAIAAFLLTASNRRLWAGVIGVNIAFLLLVLLFDYETGWDFATLTYIDFWTVKGMLRHLFFNGFHPVIPWLAFVLIGMWLGRQNVRDGRVRRRILGVAVLTAVTAETLSFILTQTVPNELAPLFTTDPMPPMPLYIAAGAGTAIAIIMLCLEYTVRRPTAWIVAPLTATGQLALTLYVAHVVIGMGILEAVGRLENQTLPFAMMSASIFFLLAVLFSYHWRKHFQRGPLEWVMRRITS